MEINVVKTKSNRYVIRLSKITSYGHTTEEVR